MCAARLGGYAHRMTKEMKSAYQMNPMCLIDVQPTMVIDGARIKAR